VFLGANHGVVCDSTLACGIVGVFGLSATTIAGVIVSAYITHNENITHTHTNKCFIFAINNYLKIKPSHKVYSKLYKKQKMLKFFKSFFKVF